MASNYTFEDIRHLIRSAIVAVEVKSMGQRGLKAGELATAKLLLKQVLARLEGFDESSAEKYTEVNMEGD